MILRIVRYHQ